MPPDPDTKHKIPVIGIVERGGNVRFQVLERVTSDRLTRCLQRTRT